MRDELKGKANNNESLILNIDDSSGDGTHWTCLYSKGGKCLYFDSYGFIPPVEVQNYCKDCKCINFVRKRFIPSVKLQNYCNDKDRYYSTFKIQAPNEVICGHYCLYVLYKLNNGSSFRDVLNELYERNNL